MCPRIANWVLLRVVVMIWANFWQPITIRPSQHNSFKNIQTIDSWNAWFWKIYRLRINLLNVSTYIKSQKQWVSSHFYIYINTVIKHFKAKVDLQTGADHAIVALVRQLIGVNYPTTLVPESHVECRVGMVRNTKNIHNVHKA